MSRIRSLEALGPFVRQFVRFNETQLPTVAAEARDPLQIELRDGVADAAIGVPHPQDVPIRRRTFDVL